MDAQRKMFLKERKRILLSLDRGYQSPNHCQYCKYGVIPPKKEIYSGTCNLAREIITNLKRCPLLDNPDRKEFIRRMKTNEPLFLCLDKSAFDVNKWAHDRLEFFNPRYKRDRPMDERQTMLI